MNTINTSIDSDYMHIGATGHRKNICSLTHRRVVGILASFDDYELLVKELADYNHIFTCYEDVLLYVNMLDGDWRLPYPVELNFMMYHEKTDRYNSYRNYLLIDDTCFYGDDYSYYTFGGYQPVSKDIKGFVIIAISLQYKPTMMKRIKSWICKTKN